MNAHLIQNWVYKYRIGALSSFKNSCLYNFVQMRYQIIFLKISAANAYKTVTNLLSFDFKPFFLALFCVIGAIPAPGIFFLWYLVQCLSGDGIKKSLQGNGEGAFPLGLDGFLLLLFSLPLITGGLGPNLQQDSPLSLWAASWLLIRGRPSGACLLISFISLLRKIIGFNK